MFPKSRLMLPAAVVTALAVAACGGTSQATTGSGASAAADTASHSASATAGGAAVKLQTITVASNTGTSGRRAVLVNSTGHAVYLLTGDSPGHPLCTSQSCLAAWPAVTSSAKSPKLGAGVHGKLTVWRHKGMRQLVLGGHPLYLYAGDGGAGRANGNGVKSFGGTWWVMNAQGQAAAASTPKTSSSGSQTSSGGGW